MAVVPTRFPLSSKVPLTAIALSDVTFVVVSKKVLSPSTIRLPKICTVPLFVVVLLVVSSRYGSMYKVWLSPVPVEVYIEPIVLVVS